MIMLEGKWKEILDCLKNSDFSILRGFYYEVKGFNFTKKKREGANLTYFNDDKNNKIINEQNKTTNVVDTLIFTRDRVVSIGFLDKDEKNHINEELIVVEKDKLQRGNLMDYKNGKFYDFEIKNGKVTKCVEQKEKSRV